MTRQLAENWESISNALMWPWVVCWIARDSFAKGTRPRYVTNEICGWIRWPTLFLAESRAVANIYLYSTDQTMSIPLRSVTVAICVGFGIAWYWIITHWDDDDEDRWKKLRDKVMNKIHERLAVPQLEKV